MDYTSQYYDVINNYSLIPSWFYELTPEDRSSILTTTLAEYVSVTTSKDNAFATYFTNYVETYNPN